jgi:putative tryptophan/tyrosine transport system substrate-binding protein
MRRVGSQSSGVSKGIFRIAICALLFAFESPSQAQPMKVSRIGYLSGGGSPESISRAAFMQVLRELGYIEGKNLVIETRHAKGRVDQLHDLAAELVRLKVDLIFAPAGPAAAAAKQATTTIPIVFARTDDPVALGLVTSLAHPGGNLTGLAQFTAELSGKRVELFKETFPKVARIAFLWSSTAGDRHFNQANDAARPLGLKVQSLDVRQHDDFERVFEAARKERVQGLIVAPHPLINNQRVKIVEFAAKSRLPAIYPLSEFIESGGLMSYAANTADIYRRAAFYVDKILKGTKPAELPVELPKKFEFVINLKTAKQIGLTIPLNVLARADKVIK